MPPAEALGTPGRSSRYDATAMHRYDDYDEFASLYDDRWGGEGLAKLRPAYDRLVLDDLRRGARVLDLCCGTGQFVADLVARGFEVTGVDGSAEMLRRARRHAPHARFLCADARTFDAGTGFDLALSTFDSLNHIMELEGLEQTFARVHTALRPGGRFAFDLNTAESFQASWKGSSGDVEEDRAFVVRCSYDPTANLAEFLLTLFVRRSGQDDWRRADLTLTQRAFDEPDLRGALSRAGFASIEIRREPATDRLFVLADRS